MVFTIRWIMCGLLWPLDGWVCGLGVIDQPRSSSPGGTFVRSLQFSVNVVREALTGR